MPPTLILKSYGYKRTTDQRRIIQERWEFKSSKFKYLSEKYDLSILKGNTLAEKFHLLFKGNQPSCIICGKPSQFRSYYWGYSLTCSKECKKELDRRNLLEKTIPILKEKKEEINSKRKQTCLEKYGVENPNQVEEFKEKSKKTCIERYDVENVFQSDEIKRRSEETCLEKYGTPKACQSQEIKDKIAQTNIEKFGFKTNLQTPEFKEKKKQKILQTYGVEYYSQTQEFKEKFKRTSLKKYNVDNPAKNKEVKEKYKQSLLSKYGTTNINSLESTQQKRRETCLEKYGVDHPVKDPLIRNKCLSHKEMTSPEKKFASFLKNRGFDFKYNHSLKTEEGSKNFDFVVFEKGNPIVAIEIDGIFYHGLIGDSDGRHVRGETDGSRFSRVPEGCKYLCIDETKIEEGIEEFLRILNVDSKGRLANSTIKHFHKSIYDVHVRNLPSPLQAWKNKDLLRRCVENRFIYASNLSSYSILNGFNVCKLAPKVSVFSASLAKYLICKYLPSYNEIFDPFSGFSGRLLGAVSSNKRYAGQDINEDHIKESLEIVKFHNLQNASLTQKDILESSGTYECLFTCAPYGNKEDWNNLNIIEKSCDEWIEECINRFKCKSYLFAVDETEKYKDYIVEYISKASLFGNSEEKAILINS